MATKQTPATVAKPKLTWAQKQIAQMQKNFLAVEKKVEQQRRKATTKK
jgi:hypothetical protein